MSKEIKKPQSLLMQHVTIAWNNMVISFGLFALNNDNVTSDFESFHLRVEYPLTRGRAE
jgi:hypothetical protein